MKQLQPFWYTPKHQVKGKGKIEIELQPLDQRTYIFLKGELRRVRGQLMPTAEGMIGTFQYAVTNWRGHDVEFSEDAKEAVAEGAADPHWAQWMEEIAGVLLRRALIGEPETKNS
jgi:hypothetical protein